MRSGIFKTIAVALLGLGLISAPSRAQRLVVELAGGLVNDPVHNRVIGVDPVKTGLYDVPHRLDDGWPVAAAEDLGLDRRPLAKLTKMLQSGEEFPNVQGLLIVEDGYLVYEQYFEGEDRRYGKDGVRHPVKWS